MKKLKLYLETSVWNFYFAQDAPEKKALTVQFFDHITDYEIFISDLVNKEIARASPAASQRLFTLLEQHQPTKLEITAEVLNLAQQYLDEGVLPASAVNDAIHAAVATVNEMDALLSWNLKHLANLNRIPKINGVNLKQGYSKKLELTTPMEVADEI